MKCLGVFSRFCLVAIFLIATCSLTFASGNVHIVKRSHPQRVQTPPKHAGKQKLLTHKQRPPKTSSKATTHRSKIVFKKQLRTSNGVYFLDDMESGINGWTVDTPADTLWHQTDTNCVSPTHSWWCGIDSTGTYNTGSRVNQSLISPSIDLTGATLPIHLIFNENFITEWGKDFCTVGISSDGGATWNELRTDTNSCSGTTGGWIITDFDLSYYAGNIINIRFRFDTGDELNNDFPGWYIDNVIVFSGGTIAGVTYFDVNRNGIQDPNELPLDNGDWMITATGTLFSETTWPDDDGTYSFLLPAGTYTITEELDPGWTLFSPASGNWQIILASPESVMTANFGNWHTFATIAGYVFHDPNHNGVQDSGETLFPGMGVSLDAPHGEYYQNTDSTGHYAFAVTDTGEYNVWLDWAESNVQTSPPDGDPFDVFIHDLSTNITGLGFGDYTEPPYGRTCSIGGYIFQDLNVNGILDPGEPGIAGAEVDIMGDSEGVTVTDAAGHFLFDSLFPGGYRITPMKAANWYFTGPGRSMSFDLYGGYVVDSANFGELPAPRNSSIAGECFFDANRNGAKDLGESGMGGWTVTILGLDYDRHLYRQSVVSDAGGNFVFDSLWLGRYLLSEGLRTRWVQTLPPDFRAMTVSLDSAEHHTGCDFGNAYDSVFSAGYRTFLPESIAHAMSYDGKKFGMAINKRLVTQATFTAAFYNKYLKYRAATGMQLGFKYPLTDSLVVSPPAMQTIDAGKTNVTLTFLDTVPYRQTVYIQGVCMTSKPGTTLKQSLVRPLWKFPGLTATASIVTGSLVTTPFRYMPPNGVDALMAAMPGHAIQVGLSVDRLSSHTVLMKHYGDVTKSLVDSRGTMHNGDPTCLGTYTSGSSINRQITSLPPSKQDNRLFAEAVAFKVNLLASIRGVTPTSFGDLIFDDSTGNPLNGLSLQAIAGVVDQFMSSYRDLPGLTHCQMPSGYDSLDAMAMYLTLRKIDSAFCRPIDYTSWTPGGISPKLTLTAARAVGDVPFIHIDSTSPPGGRNRPTGLAAMPEPGRFELMQNYPNPFNPTTTIAFFMKAPGTVTLKIYNTLGQEVAMLIDQESMEDGWQQIEFSTEGRSFASGVYFYRIQVDVSANNDEGITSQHFSSVKKMLMIK